MKNFDKAALIAFLAFSTHSTLVAKSLSGGADSRLSNSNLIAPTALANNTASATQQAKS